MRNKEVKVTLQQLLSLYTGGRPVGTIDFIVQYEAFFKNYGQLMYIDYLKLSGKDCIEAEKFNFKNLIMTIDEQFPKLKESSNFCKAYNEYVKRVPTLYDSKSKEVMINGCEYQMLGKRLVKAAREVLGNERYFVVKKIKSINKR